VTSYINLTRPQRLAGQGGAADSALLLRSVIGGLTLALLACLLIWLQLAGPPATVAYLDLAPVQQAPAVEDVAAADVAAAETATAPAVVAETPAAVAPPAVITLAPSPDPSITRETAIGPVPMVASDGRTALSVYARPFTAPPGQPRIAIVVAGLGQREAYAQAAIRTLPPEVTLSFSPYAGNLTSWLAEARANGHETLMAVPMEPVGYPANDPGPQTLLTSLGTEENVQRLDWALSRASGYVGVLPLMGSAFTTNEGALQPVLVALKARGLMLLDARASTQSLGGKLAKSAGVASATSTLTIDSRPTREAVAQRLGELERAALSRGSAVGITFEGAPAVLEAISAWAAGLGQRGIVLAPISAVAQ
jgi:polysaccharide deacetylase 2 family uncharacterized protein YibQ